MILPPVFSRAERAAVRAGRSAGSGFLMLRKSSGRAVRRDSITVLREMISLVREYGEVVHTWIRRDQRIDLR